MGIGAVCCCWLGASGRRRIAWRKTDCQGSLSDEVVEVEASSEVCDAVSEPDHTEAEAKDDEAEEL
jgi:hypothetical protein